MGARVVVVLVAAGAGALVVVGCLLAALFEVQGFGTPRDTEPRLGRLALFAAGVAAGVAAPLALWRLLLPDSAPGFAIVAVVAALVLVVALLGISAAG